LDINLPEVFSEFVYEIKFPEGSEIEELNLPSTYRTTTEGSRIVIIGTGENAKFLLQAKYKIPLQQGDYFEFTEFLIITVGIVIVGATIYLLNKKKKVAFKNNPSQAEPIYNKNALTDRQARIILYLEKNAGKTTQAELQKVTNLPKASLSRNLNSLESKGIIKKERKGMTMLLTLIKKRK